MILAACSQDNSPLKATVAAWPGLPKWELKPAYDFYGNRHGECHLKAILSLDNPTIIDGQPIDLRVRYENLGQAGFIYNPFFNRNIPMSAAMALFDANAHYVGDFFEHDPKIPFTGRRIPLERDWLLLPQDSYVGGHLIEEPILCSPDPDQVGNYTMSIKPGKYTVQLIFYKAFLSDPVAADWDSAAWSELFRSNPVDIEVVARSR
jgi:hypothetical protein